MNVKSDLKRIDDRLGGDVVVIAAIEQFDKPGFFEVCNHDELGLLTYDELLEKFDDCDGVQLVIAMYVDNWRGEYEREE